MCRNWRGQIDGGPVCLGGGPVISLFDPTAELAKIEKKLNEGVVVEYASQLAECGKLCPLKFTVQ